MALPVFPLIWTVIYAPFCVYCVGLFIYSYLINPKWKDPLNRSTTGDEQKASCMIITTAGFYAIATFIAFVGYIVFLIIGWSITEYINYVFALFYCLALFCLIYLWIKRLETSFAGSSLEVSKMFLRILKGMFWSVVILALVTGVLFVGQGGGDENRGDIMEYIVIIMSGVFIISFVALIGTLIHKFISKLNQLRKVAQIRLNKLNESGDYDIDSILVIQRLTHLQVKLTNAAIISIGSTFIIIITRLIFDIDGIYELITSGLDTVIGFLCVHVTIKQHQNMYGILCKSCQWICNCCCDARYLDTQMSQYMGHIKVPSTTDININVSGDTTGSGNSSDKYVIKPSLANKVSNTGFTPTPDTITEMVTIGDTQPC